MGLSNVENILQSIVDSEEYKQNPQSRVEELLLEVKEVIEEGGGGGGTVVVANPSGEATDDLIKLKVGSTIYAIPAEGGGSLTEAITVAVDVGGISAGTTYDVGTPIEDIISDLLSPTLYPSFTNPSASLSGTGSKLLETGATLAVTLTATFNRGTINPAYGTSGYRAGAATGYTLNSGTEQAENTWSETVTASNRQFSASAKLTAPSTK